MAVIVEEARGGLVFVRVGEGWLEYDDPVEVGTVGVRLGLGVLVWVGLGEFVSVNRGA